MTELPVIYTEAPRNAHSTLGTQEVGVKYFLEFAWLRAHFYS